MRPVSDQFLAALHGSHSMKVEARIVGGHQTGVNPIGVDIPIHAGDVQSDLTAEVRSTIDLTTAPDWSVSADRQAKWPLSPTDMLTPYGNEVWVRRGVEFGDGATEWVSLGYFRIDGVDQADAPLGAIRLTGSDRMAGIVDAELVAPRQFRGNTTIAAVVDNLVGEIYPGYDVEFDFDANAATLGRAMVVESDRYGFLADLAASQAKQVYFDHRGVLVFASPPDPSSPVWEVARGANGVLVTMARSISRASVFNAVVATGEGADSVTPVRGVAYDLAADSPTRWGGDFGRVPFFYNSPLITTGQQAAAAATKILRENLGLPFSLDFTALPNPALEVYDPVRVKTRDATYTHVLQRVTIPLIAQAPIAAATKDQTSTLIGVELLA